ncbi:hypothetical protein ACF0H5_011636 [Mactra antiquata]
MMCGSTVCGANSDTDCKCRRFASRGDFETDPVTYNTLCPTTYNLRATITCGTAPETTITNGVVDATTLKGSYKYMDQVKYDCINGYTYSGHDRPTQTCNLDGQWYWGAQTGQTTCSILVTTAATTAANNDDVLREVDDFEPTIKEAKGAAVFGTFGILVIVGVIGCIIGLDCLSCKKHFSLGKRNTRKFRKWFRNLRHKSGEKPQSPIDSNDFKSINETKPPDEEPSFSKNEREVTNSTKDAKKQTNPLKKPVANTRKFMANGTSGISNIITKNAAGVGLNSKPIASTSLNHNANSLKPQPKYTKPPIKRTLIRKPPTLSTTKSSQL